MIDNKKIPEDPLKFIQACVAERRVLWTYHVNMRLEERSIARRMIVESVKDYQVIEEYPEDKYLPSYLVFTRYRGAALHIMFAVDLVDENVRVVTAYRPDPNSWDKDLKRRK